jgi:NhaP-type Na+/H+ or K+/H+ antiporter
MSLVPAIGTLSLGIVIGWLVRYFIRRFKNFTPQAFGLVVSIMLGGAVVKFLDADPSVTFYYPIGLLIGFVVYTVLALFIDPKSDIATALLGPGRVN